MSDQGGGRDRKRTKSNKERAEELLHPQALAGTEPGPLAFEKEKALDKPHSNSSQGPRMATLGSNSKSNNMYLHQTQAPSQKPLERASLPHMNS